MPMVDILKITAPVAPRDNHNLQRQPQSAEGVFDLTNTQVIPKNPPSGEATSKNPFEKNELAKLNKELLGPLIKNTDILLESMKKIIILLNSKENITGSIPKEFLEKLFIKPADMLKTLLLKDQNETAFGSAFFDSLRMLAKLDNQPKLQAAIASVLKYFDCFQNSENTLDSILAQANNLPKQLMKADKELVLKLNMDLEFITVTQRDNQKEILKFLKNEYIPVFRKLVIKYNQDDTIRNSVMNIIHNIVRLDKANPKRLDEATKTLCQELQNITNLTDDDLNVLKSQIIKNAKDVAKTDDGPDVSKLISKVLEKPESVIINRAAQNLLTYMVQSESPILPIMHFVLPIDFYGEKTYGEFFIDKNCEERKGEAKDARNIFFTIDTEKNGTFEVDLLSREQYIELEIKCPERFIPDIKNIKTVIREKIEEKGYRLAGYSVGPYIEGQSIISKFPKFALRKAGINVKV